MVLAMEHQKQGIEGSPEPRLVIHSIQPLNQAVHLQHSPGFSRDKLPRVGSEAVHERKGVFFPNCHQISPWQVLLVRHRLPCLTAPGNRQSEEPFEGVAVEFDRNRCLVHASSRLRVKEPSQKEYYKEEAV